MFSSDTGSRHRGLRYWSLLTAVGLLLAAGLACNLVGQPAARETPTLGPANTIPPTRTLLPTGQVPSIVPISPLPQLTLPVLLPTAVVIAPTATPLPLATATPFPTPIPTSTPLPPINVAIYSPVNGNIVAGIIQVLGSASHPFFVQFQLEFSPDPGDLWVLIPGSISTFPLQNGLLGLWDTRQTPDGIYQLRLRVFTSDGSSTVAVVRNLRVSNHTATPPPSVTPTPTSTHTPTFTPIPTSTPVPTYTPTLTNTPTGYPTDTPSPTATFTEVLPDTATPTPTATSTEVLPDTDTPTPTFTEAPPLADLNAIPILPSLSPAMVTNLRSVYEVGLSLGNRPTVFAKAGDDNTVSPAFLTGFGMGAYNLDVYASLQTIIDFFNSTAVQELTVPPQTSFNAISYAAGPGWSTIDVLEPARADPAACQPGETPLDCEVRLSRPAVMLIMVGTHDLPIFASSPESFRANLQVIVNTCLSRGVIPILSTIPQRLDGVVTTEQLLVFNTEIVNVATASGVPLWNFWSAIRDLPNNGLSGDGITLSAPPDILPTDLSLAGLNYGFNQRNLTALQVLDAIRSTVFPDAVPPAMPTPTEVAVVPTETPTELPTATELPTLTPTFTETATELPTLTPTFTETATELPTPTPTFTETATELPTLTPTFTETATELPTLTPTFTETPTETPTDIPTETPTEAPLPTSTFPPPAVRPFPNTTDGIHVFNDRLPDGLSEAQAQFAATHYAGTQRMRPAVTAQLRAYNGNFIVLHDRFGLGLGYQAPDGGCNPSGNFLQIVEGEWRQEWPETIVDSWFAPYNGQNVYHCDQGWFLVNLNDAAWRTYFLAEASRQLSINQNDGLLLDRLVVPNYLGWDRFAPSLPPEDAGFEAAWSASIAGWIDFLKASLDGAYVIAGVGSYTAPRDTTDYSRADGLMVEDFGFDTWQAAGAGAWQTQLDRALAVANRGQVLILQSRAGGGSVDARLFSLASYLLVKGNRTFVNLELDVGVEWFPEYTIPIGSPTQSAGSLAELFRGDWGAYARMFTNGFVAVNPSGVPASLPLGGAYYQALPAGGGLIGEDGAVPGDWAVNYAEVTELTLNPGQAAILLNFAP